MKVFFDMEFTGLHQNTTPISIGMVTEEGAKHWGSFYAEFTDYDRAQVDEWISKNVISQLFLEGDYCGWIPYLNRVHRRGTRSEIATEIQVWLEERFSDVVMVGDVLGYDWVLFCQLFSGAMSIPGRVSYIPLDLATMFAERGVDPDISREAFCSAPEGQPHNAMWDAEVIKACYEKIHWRDK